MTTQNYKPKLNKKIFIVDCDFLYKTSTIPNYKAMKLSSYHKQLGHDVVFINNEYQLTGNHTILYLIRELRHTQFPPGDILDDKRTILMGEEFKIFDDYQNISDEVAICRPDYTLYEYEEKNVYNQSNYVQFFNNDKLLKNVQDWHRAKYKATIVVDQNFWDAPPQIIVDCLKSLQGERNIIFLHPIKLKKLLNDDVFYSFSKLKLAKYYKVRYNNNIGENYDNIVQAIDLMKRIKIEFAYLNIGSIPVKIITKDHWVDKANVMYDFERCLKIMTYAQSNRVRINFKYPKIRLSSPSWAFFEFFKTWGNHYHTLPYIEALMKGATLFHQKGYAEILNNSLWWNTAKIKQAVYLIAQHTELIQQYGFIGWGGVKSTTESLINYQYIKEKAIEDNLF